MESLKDLVNEVNIEIKTDGLQIQSLDSTHTCLVYLEWKKEYFSDQRCDRNSVIAINVGNFSKILRNIQGESLVSLTTSMETNQLKLVEENTKGGKTTTQELRLINNLDSEDMDPKDDGYSVVCTLSAKEFSDICRQLAAIDDKISIEADKEGITLKVAGDLGKAEISLTNHVSDEAERNILMQLDDSQEPNIFSSKQLLLFNKCSSFSPNVTLCLHSEKPMVIKQDIIKEVRQGPNGAEGEVMGKMLMFLAPKVSETE